MRITVVIIVAKIVAAELTGSLIWAEAFACFNIPPQGVVFLMKSNKDSTIFAGVGSEQASSLMTEHFCNVSMYLKNNTIFLETLFLTIFPKFNEK